MSARGKNQCGRCGRFAEWHDLRPDTLVDGWDEEGPRTRHVYVCDRCASRGVQQAIPAHQIAQGPGDLPEPPRRGTVVVDRDGEALQAGLLGEWWEAEPRGAYQDSPVPSPMLRFPVIIVWEP